MSKGGLLTSFSNGYVIKTDGSSMKIPTIELNQLTKEQYVPTNFARDTIKVIEDENISLRQSYETQIQHLTNFYKKSLEGARNHYEALINEAKSKGLRHVEIQKQFKKEMEEQLKSEVSNLQINIEQLRDSLAELSLKYQEQTREYNSYIKKSEILVAEQLQKINNLQIDFVNLKEDILNDKLINKECSALLINNLIKIEINERKEILSTIEKDKKCHEKLNMEIFELNSEKLVFQKYELEQKKNIEKGLNNIEILEQHIVQLNTDVIDLNTKITDEVELNVKLNLEINSLKNSSDQYLMLINNSIVESKLKSAKIKKLEEELNDQYIITIVNNCLNSTISSIIETTHIHNLENELKQKINTIIQDENERKKLLQEEIKLQHAKILEYEQKLKHSLEELLQSKSTPRKQLDINIPEKVEISTQNNPSRIDFLTGETSNAVSKANNLSDDYVDEIEKYKTLIQELEEKLKNTIIENKPIITESMPVIVDSNSTQFVTISNDELEKYKTLIQELKEKLKNTIIENHHRSLTINNSSSNVSSKSNLVDRQSLKVLFDSKQAELAETNIKFIQTEAKLKEIIDKKNNAKLDIKKWADEFTKQNGRAPGKEDKAQVRDKYFLFQNASSELKEIQSIFEEIKEGKAVLDLEASTFESKIIELDELIPDDTLSELFIKDKNISITKDETINHIEDKENSKFPILDIDINPVVKSDKLIDKPIDNVVDKVVSIVNSELIVPEGSQIIEISYLESLDDQIYQLKQKIEQSKEETEKIIEEKQFISQKLEEIIKEKRSDVLKILEMQVQTLLKEKEKVAEEILALKIEDGKKEMKLRELKERAETAESDLKDIAENNDSKLKITISNQRNEIVLKSKATTAGWDAAADAEEKLIMAETKARLAAIEEYKKLHENDNTLLHNAIEEKQVRITELMVNINKYEKDIIDAENKCLLLQKQVLQAQEDAADAFAQFGSGGGDGVSSELLDQARNDLNQAQEEYIAMSENYENILQKKEIGDKKIEILEKLLEVANLKPKSVKVTKTPKAKVEKSLNKSDNYSEIPSILLGIKNAIVKGTLLWKNNLRDDCYDLYLTISKSAVEHLKSNELRNPLKDAIHSAIKQSKARGAVILRKSFDRLISDAQNPEIKELEEIAYASAHVVVEEEEEDDDDDDDDDRSTSSQSPQDLKKSLIEALLILNEESVKTIEVEKDGNESYIDTNKSGVTANLLKRAQAAEKMVEFLKNESLKAKESVTKNNSSNNNSSNNDLTNSPSITNLNSKSGIDPSELRSLQRQIKSLETALAKEKTKSAANNTTNNNNDNASIKDRGNDRKDPIADKKALIAAEKVSAKKIKDLETSFKKEKTALEARLKKAELGLETSASQLPAIIEERDLLKFKVKEQTKELKEMEILRDKANQLIVIQNELNDKNNELTLLSAQFAKESALRKKYKNELEDLKGAIRVYARCRPVAKYEIEKDCKVIVDLPNETSVQVQTSRGEKEFEFDAAFNMQSTQDEVFEDTKRLVESCLDGFNVCIFAYGQTGSGKTFTMTGSKDMPGITPKSITELFRLIDERKHCNIKVTTYFVELYNDNLVDLYFALENKKKHEKPPKLDIKVDAHKMVFINNVVIKEANNSEDLMDLFTAGNLERHTGATKMNAESSRSHSIFSILVESYDTNTKKNVIGKLSIVDLAGSERADKTGAGEERLKEAQNINKSLSALGDVISALSEGAKFIPYRNNKLTQVMQDSLGGNAKTLMFVNFSPVDYNADETITSLNYATRVKKIVNNASKQVDNEEIARLKAQIKELQLHGFIKKDNDEKEDFVENGDDI